MSGHTPFALPVRVENDSDQIGPAFTVREATNPPIVTFLSRDRAEWLAAAINAYPTLAADLYEAMTALRLGGHLRPDGTVCGYAEGNDGACNKCGYVRGTAYTPEAP
jgi:hypothetical protein